MKKFSSLLCAVILSAQSITYAAEKSPDINNHYLESETTPVVTQSTTPSDDDKLRGQKISTDVQPAKKMDLTETEWRANPTKLQQTLLFLLATNQVNHLNNLPELYGLLPANTRDDSLIEWAHAMRLTQTNLRQSIHEYRILLGKFTDNDFIRFQLAALLYQNQEFDAAKGQFQKLRASPQMTEKDMGVFDKYLTAIENKDKWHFSLGTSLLRDKNLTEMAAEGTVMTLPNGATFTQITPKESGTGFNFGVNTEKRWSLQNGQYIGLAGSGNLKYYWNNHKFNELTGYIGTSYGYANSNIEMKATPYYMKRWYAGGGSNDSDKLKSYTHSLGISTSLAAWLTPTLKHSTYANYSHETYANDNMDKRYGGNIKSVGTSLLYLRGTKQYFGSSLDLMRRDVGTETNSYKRYGGRVFWGQEWPKGFATQVSLSLAKRKYQAPWLGIVRRSDKEWNANVSLWHKAVHFYGVTPRLTFNYQKTKSNIPIYSYDKNITYIELDKSF